MVSFDEDAWLGQATPLYEFRLISEFAIDRHFKLGPILHFPCVFNNSIRFRIAARNILGIKDINCAASSWYKYILGGPSRIRKQALLILGRNISAAQIAWVWRWRDKTHLSSSVLIFMNLRLQGLGGGVSLSRAVTRFLLLVTSTFSFSHTDNKKCSRAIACQSCLEENHLSPIPS
jgi:hypothetical protein